MTDTAELERLASSITPGPWRKYGKMTGKVISEGPEVGTVEICETGDFRDAELIPYNADRWNADADAIALVPDLLAEVIALRSEVDGYMEWAQDVKRLTRQLDIEMHGDGAAQQASLCDLIGAGKDMRDRAEKAEARAAEAEADAERLAEALAFSKRHFGFNAEVLNALAAHTQRVNAKEDTQ